MGSTRIAALVRRQGSLTAAILCLLLSSPANAAGTEPKQRATELVEQGNSRYQAGDYLGAADAYSQALELFPSPKIHFNLAEAQRGLGHFGAAIAGYREFLNATAPKPGSKLDRAVAARISDMEARGGYLELRSELENSSLEIDGRPVERAGKILLAPGPHRVSASAEGYSAFEAVIEIESGRTTSVLAELARLAEPPPEPPPPPPPPVIEAPERSPPITVVEAPRQTSEEDSILEAWWFWAAIAVAGAATAGAVALGSREGGAPPPRELGTSSFSEWSR